MSTRLLSSVLLLTALASVPHTLAAQDRWYREWRRPEPRFADEEALKDRRFIFCRVIYTSVHREAGGQGWRTDYPTGDRNFMQRLGELTKAAVARDEMGEPDFRVVSLTEHDIFSCPFLFMSDVGTMGLSETETRRLRDYLLKGGFLYVDDFWGSYAWNHWEREIRKVLPAPEYPLIDIDPGHPLRHILYSVSEIPQIPSIQFWRGTGGSVTSERGSDSAVPHLRAIADPAGRLVVVITHNTDIADGWEREGEEYEFFHQFSPDSYALAINIVLYAMTH